MNPRTWSRWTKAVALFGLVALGGTLWGWSAHEEGEQPSGVGGRLAGQTARGAGVACNVGETGGGPRMSASHVGVWNDRVTVFELDENACPRPVEVTSWRIGELPGFQRTDLERGIPFQTDEEKYLILEGLEPHG